MNQFLNTHYRSPNIEFANQIRRLNAFASVDYTSALISLPALKAFFAHCISIQKVAGFNTNRCVGGLFEIGNFKVTTDAKPAESQFDRKQN
jgi:hypothetical protein